MRCVPNAPSHPSCDASVRLRERLEARVVDGWENRTDGERQMREPEVGDVGVPLAGLEGLAAEGMLAH